MACHLLPNHFNIITWLRSAALLSVALCVIPGAQAANPCVRFDVVQITGAADISSNEFLTANPDEKLIRIRLPISSLVHLGDEENLLQYLYLVSGSATSSFQIEDYAPKTTLASDVAGPISVEQNSGNSTNIGLKADAPKDLPVNVDASASRNVSSSNSQRLQRLPPKYLVAASGTMHRGLSAYFKLRPSSQTTLEGEKTFEIVARVPYNWRAGLIHVRCAAYATNGNKSGKKSPSVCSNERFVVGVYIDGDEVAKQRVWDMARKQHQLQTVAQQHAGTIDDERFPSLGHKLGAVFSVTKPRIPDQWLDQLLMSSEFQDFERHLPRKVRSAATEYRQARQQVIRFAG